MTSPRFLAYAAAGSMLLAAVSAQSGDNSGPGDQVWAAVAFINHGERTPVLGNLPAVLTPDGAQQMWSQGQAFRSRYLGSNSTGANLNTTTAKIQNMPSDTIDNTQLVIVSQTDPWVVSGATAFLQGLYPPTTQADPVGGKGVAQNLVAGSQSIKYPLNGYQYPVIETLSNADGASVAIQGTVGCSAWDTANNNGLRKRTDLNARAKQSEDFYAKLFSETPLKGSINSTTANFWNAGNIYDYVNYMYHHDETVFKGLADANNTLATLRSDAFSLENAKNSDNTTKPDDSSNILHSIAGRALATDVVNQIQTVVNSTGSSQKLTLMFGSLEPILAFFSVGLLQTEANMASGPFGQVPEPGAAMVFELIGPNSQNGKGLPATQDLRVRFYYRASARSTEQFNTYSLFGSDYGGPSLAYTLFTQKMSDAGKDVEGWCGICKPQQASFCSQLSSTPGGHKSGSSMSPAVSGIIGAVIMGAIIGLVGLGLFALGGFRVRRRLTGESGSTLGGFKGPEKLTSDTDVTVTKRGQPDERIGSWEMRDGGAEGTSHGHVGIITSDFHRGHSLRHEDEDGVSLTGAAPTRVHENV